MTAIPTIAPSLLEVIDSYRTCEFATLNKAGVPITWPAVTVRRADGTFLLTTSIALAQKAFNVRRDPRVALLFSDPTGSGLHGAPQLLVRGTAACPDEIVTGALADADYWGRLAARQPSSRSQRSNPLSSLVLGELAHGGTGWTFTTTRTVGPPGTGAGPLATVRIMRDVRRQADRYLARRGLPRPRIAWNEFASVDQNPSRTTLW